MKHSHTYILTNSENSGQPATRYITGFSGSDSTLVFSIEKPLSENKPLENIEWGKLMLDGRYWEQGETEVQSTKCRVQSGRIEIVRVHKDYTSKQALADIIKQCSMTECIVDSRITSYESVLTLQGQGLKLISSPNIFQSIREIKSKEEIVQIQKAQKIALDAYEAVFPEIVPGVKESYIAARLEFLIKQGGAERVAFEPIVASGTQSALPHARATEKTIHSTDSVIIDFGAVYGGYCSDFTRTILMSNVPAKLREIYHVVQDAKQKATAIAIPGVQASNIDQVARDIIEDAGYGAYFTHSTGHGVGMEVHELPFVSAKSETTLQNGHIITIEPGIYVPGLGGVRLEDMVIL